MKLLLLCQKFIQNLLENQIRKTETNGFDNTKLSDKSILREVLLDLTHEGYVSPVLYISLIPGLPLKVKKLNLLRESLQHKTEVYQTDKINKVKNAVFF